MSKQFYFKQFSNISTQFSSIYPIDRTLLGATTPTQNGPGSDGNEGVLRIPQSFSITGTSPSDCLVSYSGQLLGGASYPFAEVQSVYYPVQADSSTVTEERSEYIHAYPHWQRDKNQQLPSQRGLEYADCISLETSVKLRVLGMTLNYIQWWYSVSVFFGVPLRCCYLLTLAETESQLHSLN